MFNNSRSVMYLKRSVRVEHHAGQAAGGREADQRAAPQQHRPAALRQRLGARHPHA